MAGSLVLVVSRTDLTIKPLGQTVTTGLPGHNTARQNTLDGASWVEVSNLASMRNLLSLCRRKSRCLAALWSHTVWTAHWCCSPKNLKQLPFSTSVPSVLIESTLLPAVSCSPWWAPCSFWSWAGACCENADQDALYHRSEEGSKDGLSPGEVVIMCRLRNSEIWTPSCVVIWPWTTTSNCHHNHLHVHHPTDYTHLDSLTQSCQQ